MARDQKEPSNASVIQLDKPEDLQTVLAKDKKDDCLSCRVTGASAFIGLGAYSYFSGKNQLQRREAAIMKSGTKFGLKHRQAASAGIAAAFVAMGLWRLVN